MDSERLFLSEEPLENITFEELSTEDLNCVKHHVELVRHLQELHQLYEIVLFNLNIMRHNYVWRSSGEVLYKGTPAEGPEHFTAVNAMIINLIGSARSLTESMDCYMKENYSDSDSEAQAFFQFSHLTYDTCFAYRLLIRLRDFSQHGHPPVSQTGSCYSFDLHQIKGMPHFTHNKQIKSELEAAVKSIMEDFHGQPTLGVTMTVAEFSVALLKVYSHFLTCVEPHLKDSFLHFRETLERYPENILRGDMDTNNFFVFSIEDNLAHVVFPEDNAMKLLITYQSAAKEALDRFAADWDSLTEGTLLIKRKGDTISIEPFSESL